jgi:nucleoside-diphosphate-sugar epimerase
MDLASGAPLSPDIVEDADVIFHCAGEVRDSSAMRLLHVEGTQRLLATLAQRRQLPRWVQLSSVGAYGPPHAASVPRVVDEMAPERPLGDYEVTKTESDRLVRRFADEHGMPYAILRPSSVIGAGMSNASMRAVIAMIERGWFFYIGRNDAIANYVHVHDVAAALVACGTRPQAPGHTFNLSSDCSWVSLVQHIASARGVRPPRLRLPERTVRIALAVASAALPTLPLTPARISALAGRTRYPSAKIEAVLGFRCGKPMPAAVDELLMATH